MSNCCNTGDCPTCRPMFQSFIDGQFNDPEDCPQSVEGKCPKCWYELQAGYGFAGDYGIGVYQRCPKCGEIYDFVSEPEI